MNLTKIVSTLTASSVAVLGSLVSVSAQVIPDGTTPTTVDVNGDINGGSAAGTNLFHSFSEFSIPNGGRAFFNNNLDIVNIFSRVTGGKISDINGLLGAKGTANLFFINPAGIIFGENARLSIGGSFYGSSASSILFPDGEFSAVNPESGITLTINVPIGLSLRDDPGPIINRSISEGLGLFVPEGESIFLVGGSVQIEDGGIVFAPGGRVELGGLSEAGTVSFRDDGSLGFPDGVGKSDVSLSGGALVSVLSDGGGDISVNAKDLELADSSLIRAGINRDLGSPNAQGGDIVVNAGGDISVDGGGILNVSRINAIGNAGDITITTRNLTLTNGGDVDASTYGRGNAGSVKITASDSIAIDGDNSDGFPSGATSQVSIDAVGNAGGVTITTGSLNLTNGGSLSASTLGQGNAGSVEIAANDSITIDGDNSDGFVSLAASVVGTDAVGNAGGVIITTGNLILTNGGAVNSSTYGRGDAGSVEITVSNSITFDGEDSDGFVSGAGSTVGTDAVGNAGGVIITTGNLILTNGGIITASTYGRGDAGSVEITASNSITFDGENSDGFVSGAGSTVGTDAVGNAGGVIITTGNLILTNGGTVTASTYGRGDAGSVEITANDSITIDGENSDGFVSGATSVVTLGAVGDAGGITITTGNLTLTNGGFVDASTKGQGNAGSVDITANDSIIIDGENPGGFASSAGSQVSTSGVGNAGGVTITTGNLTLTNGGRVDASTFGQGNAGVLKINASGDLTLNNGQIRATNQPSDNQLREGGNVTLDIEGNILLRNNSTISAQAFNNNNGGNLIINADSIVAFPTRAPGDGNDIVASAPEGKGGSITINADGLFNIKQRQAIDDNQTNDIDATGGLNNGTVTLNLPESSNFQETTEVTTEELSTNVVSKTSCSFEGEVEEGVNLVQRGRGGIPPEPTEPMMSEPIILTTENNPKPVNNEQSTVEEEESELVEQEYEDNYERMVELYKDDPTSPYYIPPYIKPVETSSGPIYPARGIARTPDGRIILTAYPTNNNGERLPYKGMGCD